MDRLFWWDGAQWQPQDAPHISGLASGLVVPPAKGKVRPPGYWRDFWLGFAGTVAGNIVLAIVSQAALGSNPSAFGSVASLAPWVLNILALVVFAIVRPRVAIGMLVAYATGLALALLAGIFLLVLCFGMARGGGVP